MTEPKNPLRGALALSVHRALIKPDAPLPVSGTAILPGLTGKARVLGFVGGDSKQGVRIDLEIVDLAPGRPPDDGRRIAVLLAFELLTVAEGFEKTPARELIAERMGYEEWRGVQRVLRDRRTCAAKASGTVFVARADEEPGTFAVLRTGGDSLESVLAPGPSTTRYLVSGWLWRPYERAARFGTYDFTLTKN